MRVSLMAIGALAAAMMAGWDWRVRSAASIELEEEEESKE